ncbi:GSCOCG00012296001-RA-CDS [Cotesia congregata]|nr:GSCOCG00012296001-RA-CDS [Cotesia congregata]
MHTELLVYLYSKDHAMEQCLVSSSLFKKKTSFHKIYIKLYKAHSQLIICDAVECECTNYLDAEIRTRTLHFVNWSYQCSENFTFKAINFKLHHPYEFHKEYMLCFFNISYMLIS